MRRVGAFAAILASLVYTMLATWHGVAMGAAAGATASPEARLELALQTAICHNAVGEETSSATPPDGPSNDTSTCPVCKGLAAFQVVLLAAAELGLLTPPETAVRFSWSDESGTDRTWISPRSRGPPQPV